MQKKYNSVESINKLIPKDSLLKAIELLGFRETPSERRRVALCKCKCGNTHVTIISLLVSGKSKSCGCRKYKKPSTTKGNYLHPLYSVWTAMITRCYSTRCKYYKRYGGRGITVCNIWRNDFNVFFEWAINNGWRKGLDLDRERNSGNYEPSNCRFVTRQININNVDRVIYITYNDKKMTLMQWSKELGICRGTLYSRYKSKKPISEILYKP